jgi:hypothetical protein
MFRASRPLLALVVVATVFAYPASYAAFRLTHVLVHDASFISEEGLNAHVWHSIRGDESRRRWFSPLISAELWFWQRWKP